MIFVFRFDYTISFMSLILSSILQISVINVTV
jgi:hypothetical protein